MKNEDNRYKMKWSELEDELAQRMEWTEWKMDCYGKLHCRNTTDTCTDVCTLLKPVYVGNHITKCSKVLYSEMHYNNAVSEGSNIMHKDDGIQRSKCKSLTSKKKEAKKNEERTI